MTGSTVTKSWTERLNVLVIELEKKLLRKKCTFFFAETLINLEFQ